jgi:hypothetical protein
MNIPWSTTGERRKTLDCYNVMLLIVGGTSAKAKEFPHMVNRKRIKKIKNIYTCKRKYDNVIAHVFPRHFWVTAAEVTETRRLGAAAVH